MKIHACITLRYIYICIYICIYIIYIHMFRTYRIGQETHVNRQLFLAKVVRGKAKFCQLLCQAELKSCYIPLDIHVFPKNIL